MTPPSRPTALTEEEQYAVVFLESLGSGFAADLLAIIRRLDARVGELERALTEAGELRKNV